MSRGKSVNGGFYQKKRSGIDTVCGGSGCTVASDCFECPLPDCEWQPNSDWFKKKRGERNGEKVRMD